MHTKKKQSVRQRSSFSSPLYFNMSGLSSWTGPHDRTLQFLFTKSDKDPSGETHRLPLLLQEIRQHSNTDVRKSFFKSPVWLFFFPHLKFVSSFQSGGVRGLHEALDPPPSQVKPSFSPYLPDRVTHRPIRITTQWRKRLERRRERRRKKKTRRGMEMPCGLRSCGPNEEPPPQPPGPQRETCGLQRGPSHFLLHPALSWTVIG